MYKIFEHKLIVDIKFDTNSKLIEYACSSQISSIFHLFQILLPKISKLSEADALEPSTFNAI